MDTLILVGCFGVALVALILLVLTIRATDNASDSSSDTARSTPGTASSTSAPPRRDPAPAQLITSTETLTTPQLQHITEELHTLQDQARDLAERLETMTHAIGEIADAQHARSAVPASESPASSPVDTERSGRPDR